MGESSLGADCLLGNLKNDGALSTCLRHWKQVDKGLPIDDVPGMCPGKLVPPGGMRGRLHLGEFKPFG